LRIAPPLAHATFFGGFADGVYSNPEWSKGHPLPQDWIDFVAGVIDRSRKVREHLEAAPHQLENA
jgi:hypothetical protein